MAILVRASAHHIKALTAMSLFCVLMALCFFALMPAQKAWGYFDRGTVQVEPGCQQLDLTIGQTGSVSLSFTPSSDAQTPGCGMPSCPQKCAVSCLDENGQCTCGGTEYTTYFPTATASSSNAGVARAFCSGNTLYVIGISAGQSTISITASLRQFHDSTATLEVQVTGEGTASATVISGWEESLPAVSEPDTSDRENVVNKTIMNRPIRYVRIEDDLDALTQMKDFAGVDGDLTFWTGENYYAPAYSLTFKASLGNDLTATFDPSCTVATEASGELTQPLYGKSGYLVLDFAQHGDWPARANVYVATQGLFADGSDVALFSYDTSTKSLIKEDIEVSVEGDYAVCLLNSGKMYVLAPADFQANTAAVNTGSTADESSSSATSGSAETLNAVPLVLAAAALCVIAVAVFLLHRVRKAKEN